MPEALYKKVLPSDGQKRPLKHTHPFPTVPHEYQNSGKCHSYVEWLASFNKHVPQHIPAII